MPFSELCRIIATSYILRLIATIMILLAIFEYHIYWILIPLIGYKLYKNRKKIRQQVEIWRCTLGIDKGRKKEAEQQVDKEKQEDNKIT